MNRLGRRCIVGMLAFLLGAAGSADAQVPQPRPRPTPAQPAQPTRAEIEAIQRKLQNAWVPPANAADVRRLQIDLRVALDSDGTVLAVSTVDQARLSRDALFRSAAASAEAAVWRASPLPVPRDKAAFFKAFVLSFVPPPHPAN